MSDFINDWISENIPSFVVSVVIICFLLIAIGWALRMVWVILKKVKGLPCDERNSIINEHISDHKAEIKEINTSINFMQKTLEILNSSMLNLSPNQKNFLITKSPISITEEGYKMVSDLKVMEMLEKNWDRINEILDKEASSKNPYDIQQYCIRQAVVFPDLFLDKDEMDVLKTDAYNKGLPFSTYMRVVAVLARDRYFDEHGIDVTEVDKHSPEH